MFTAWNYPQTPATCRGRSRQPVSQFCSVHSRGGAVLLAVLLLRLALLSLVLLLHHLLLLLHVLVALLDHGEEVASLDEIGIGVGYTCVLHVVIAL